MSIEKLRKIISKKHRTGQQWNNHDNIWWGKSLLLGVKTWGFEADFDDAKLILLIGCPSCHQTIKMMESTLLNHVNAILCFSPFNVYFQGCQYGRYSKGGATVCDQCDAGYNCTSDGILAECGTGQFSPAGNPVCIPCSDGQICPTLYDTSVSYFILFYFLPKIFILVLLVTFRGCMLYFYPLHPIWDILILDAWCVHLCVCICMCVHVYICACMNVCVCMHACTCGHVSVSVCVHTCMPVCFYCTCFFFPKYKYSLVSHFNSMQTIKKKHIMPTILVIQCMTNNMKWDMKASDAKKIQIISKIFCMFPLYRKVGLIS